LNKKIYSTTPIDIRSRAALGSQGIFILQKPLNIPGGGRRINVVSQSNNLQSPSHNGAGVIYLSLS